MGWPRPDTPEFYIHNRICEYCASGFDGYSTNRYCSQRCKDIVVCKRNIDKYQALLNRLEEEA